MSELLVSFARSSSSHVSFCDGRTNQLWHPGMRRFIWRDIRNATYWICPRFQTRSIIERNLWLLIKVQERSRSIETIRLRCLSIHAGVPTHSLTCGRNEKLIFRAAVFLNIFVSLVTRREVNLVYFNSVQRKWKPDEWGVTLGWICTWLESLLRWIWISDKPDWVELGYVCPDLFVAVLATFLKTFKIFLAKSFLVFTSNDVAHQSCGQGVFLTEFSIVSMFQTGKQKSPKANIGSRNSTRKVEVPSIMELPFSTLHYDTVEAQSNGTIVVRKCV